MNERAKSKRLRRAGPVFVLLVLAFWLYSPVSTFVQGLFHRDVQRIEPYTFQVESSVTSVEISPDARYILVLSEDRMSFWDPFSRHRAAEIAVDTPVHFAKFSPDGHGVLIKSKDRLQYLRTGSWSLADTTIRGLDYDVERDDEDAYVSYGAEEITSILSAISKRQKAALWKSRSVRVMQVDLWRNRILAFDPSRKILHLQNEEKEFVIPCRGTPRSPDVSADGKTVAWLETDEGIVYDVASGTRRTFDKPRDARMVAINADSSLMAVVKTEEIIVFDLNTLEQRALLKSEVYIHDKVVFAGDYVIAVSGTTPQIEMWKI